MWSAVFDEPNLVSRAGLVLAMALALALAERCGLVSLADGHLTVPGGPGHAGGLKVSGLVAGMVAGTDSIADMAVLQHGGMDRLFTVDGWTKIRYPKAVFGEQLGQWISDAEVTETPFTAFTSRGQAGQVPVRLIVRRVRDANPAHVVAIEQGELFPVWRYHAAFTDPLPMLTAEADHRRHAIIEQVIADLKNGPLAHLPSGNFMANST